MEELDLSTLESRPTWYVVRWLKIATLVIFMLSMIMILMGLVAGYIYMSIPSGEESALEAFYGAISSTLENSGYYGISIGFYALVLWLISQGVDRVDQLVWLNADNTDREYLYNSRKKKKNAKNQ
jgi:hypothetical protein